MSEILEVKPRTEVRDGMRITWHQPIPTDDGIVLRADVFRPSEDGRYPVILSYGVYAKGLAFQEGYPLQWAKMISDYPQILQGSTNPRWTLQIRPNVDGAKPAIGAGAQAGVL